MCIIFPFFIAYIIQLKYISDNHIDYSKVMNENCGTFYELPISTTELCIRTENIKNMSAQSTPLLKITLGNDKFVFYIIICR